MIIQYIRNRSNNLKGVLVAQVLGMVKDGVPYVCIGWSLCSKRDKFDKVVGKDLASARCHTIRTRIPDSIKEDYLQFKVRCMKYFKNAVIGG